MTEQCIMSPGRTFSRSSRWWPGSSTGVSRLNAQRTLVSPALRQYGQGARRTLHTSNLAQLQPRPTYRGPPTPPPSAQQMGRPQRSTRPYHQIDQPQQQGYRPQRRSDQQLSEQRSWNGPSAEKLSSMGLADLERAAYGMVQPREIDSVPTEVAAAVVQCIAEAAGPKLSRCSAYLVSMFIWEVFALYEAGKQSREEVLPSMQALVMVAKGKAMSQFKPIDVAQITLNLAKFGLGDAKWFDRLAAGQATGLAWEGVEGAKGVEQSIANTIYGLAVAERSDAAGLVDHLLATVMTKCTISKPQHASNILWALAKMQHPLDSPQLLAATGHKDAASLVGTFLEGAVLPYLDRFDSQHVANVMYALALLQLPCSSETLSALVDRMLVLIQEPRYDPQHVSNTVWSCVKLQHPLSTEHTLLLTAALVRAAGGCQPQSMVSMMWALSTGGYSAAALRLQKPLHTLLEMRAADFIPQGISNIAVALAKLGHHYPALFSTLVAAAKLKLGEFNTQALVNLLHSLAVMEPTSLRAFFQELQPLLLSRLSGFDEQNVANISWAYAVVLGDHTSKELALGLCHAAASHKLTAEEQVQVFQLMAVSSSEVQATVAADTQLLRLSERCRMAYTKATGSQYAGVFTKQVQVIVPALGADFIPGFGVECFGVQVKTNLLQSLGGKRVVFDWVPPARYSSHSTTEQQHHQLGAVLLRKSMLTRGGWPDAVMVPVAQWEGLEGDKARLQYLRQKLKLS